MPKTDSLRMAPPPPDLPMTPFAVGGTIVWAVLGAVLALFFDERLVEAGRGWWIDACWAGVVSGLVGTVWMLLHDRRRPGRKRG